ncbi:TIR domain-containing protein [Candidatus Merdisoma sp. JLR.KK006]|uniref:TIR domain-containing protein n=1 Tax=Candidatus Merdisoma sp. JLR.KK006 TaxID=3112626 RepID=UPI002FF088EE
MRKKDFEYKVALSFAGEQRDYVEKVSKELTRLNVKHFYDYKEQVDLWGKNLIQYLDSVYFEKALYFVPFISAEYVEKVWTRLEVSSALDRNKNESRPNFQQYILPVRFDDTRVPGLVGSIAYIDARKSTPRELARMIYEKLNGNKKKAETDSEEDNTQFLPINYNNKINADKLKAMENVYLLQNKSHAMIVYGEKGLGKRSCTQCFIQKKKNVIKIYPNLENRFQLESVIHALKLDTNGVSSDSDLCFEEKIKKEFFAVCKKKPMIVYVEKFQDFDSQTAAFLVEITEILLSRFPNFQTFVIFELDIQENMDALIPFYKFSPSHTDFIYFNRLGTEELKHYFFKALGNISISDENLTYILDSSFGNIMYLNIAINYLKGENYILLDAGKYICDTLPSGILADVLKEFILQRYDRLDQTLKEVLSKSSIIGNVFNAELLSKPFQIINADNMLQKIEKISQLIIHPDDLTYSFENNDVYNLIKNSISPELQKEWHEILANYYKKLLKKEQRRKGLKAIDREIAALYPIAKHFKYAQNYDAAIIYYIELVSKYERISDYIHELAAIQDIKYMLEYVDLDSLHLDSLEYNVFKAEADCYRNIGNYSKACQVYEECLGYFDIDDFSESIVELLYQKAYCLYMSGDLDGTLKILNHIKEHFEKNEIFNVFYIKLLSLLASVCDATGDEESQKKYYTKALEFYKDKQYEQEYYVLLRMASMVFGEEIGINMEKTAETFFRKQNSTRYLAEVLHNIATDHLYMDELEKVSEPINESIDLFDSFGSIAVHYPLNTKGIFKMVLDGDYETAIRIFEQALQYKAEPYSEIAIRTNILNCMNVLGRFKEALEQLAQIDKLIKEQEPPHIPVYTIYQNLNWAFYFFHTKEFEKCLQKIDACSKLDYMEPRFKYIYKSLKYKTKKMLGLKTRNTAGTATKKVHKRCLENGFYFTTLRFYESI